MQNDLCLKVGDTVLWRGNWVSVLATEDDKFWYDKKSSFAYVSEITEVKYNFRNGDHARNEKTGVVFIVTDADLLNADGPGNFTRVSRDATTDQFVLSNAHIGEVRIIPKSGTVTIPDDIFHVEKRLKGGKRVFNDLTVTVTPIAGHAAVQVSFNQPVTPVYNVATLREIASLLNEIADCL